MKARSKRTSIVVLLMIFFASVLLITPSVTSCSKEDGSPSNLIIGTWQLDSTMTSPIGYDAIQIRNDMAIEMWKIDTPSKSETHICQIEGTDKHNFTLNIVDEKGAVLFTTSADFVDDMTMKWRVTHGDALIITWTRAL